MMTRRRKAGAVWLAMSVCLLSAKAWATPEVGKTAPPFKVVTYGGKTVSLSDLKGDVVLLNFWATWCVPCRKELPLLETTFKAYAKYGYQVLAVATEDSVDESKLRPLAAHFTIPFVHALKGPYKDLGAIPTNYLIDRSGKLVYAKAAAFDLEALNALLLPLLREPIPEETTAPAAPADAGKGLPQGRSPGPPGPPPGPPNEPAQSAPKDPIKAAPSSPAP